MATESDARHLSRSLTLFPTTALVIGSVVGSGIFVSTAGMARALESAPLLLGVWFFTGVLTLFGAFTQCELVGQMPRTGGLYEYLKQIYGEPVGFLYGWANFMIAGSGAIAAIAFIFATYIGEIVPLPHLSAELEKWALAFPLIGTVFPLADLGAKLLGVALIAFLTWLNMRGVKLGALVQSISTSSKVLAILLVVGTAFLAGGHVGALANLTASTARGAALSGWTLVGAVGMAMGGAFWSYDGWGNVAYVAGEVHEPSKTVPRAIVLGSFCFIALYLLLNVSYLYILPVQALGKVAGDRVASGMVSAVLGSRGAGFVAALIILSTFDTTNSSILTNARVYYAMAHDGIFWRKAGAIHKSHHTPYMALVCQGVWSAVLLMTGSYDSITSMYVFVNWALYVLMALGLFILRARNPGAKRPFEVPGYPWVPGIFTVFAVIYLSVTLVTDVQAFNAGEQPLIKSVAGSVLVLSGFPLYWWWRRAARLAAA